MSFNVFNTYSEMILCIINDHTGVKVNGHNITNLRYADHTILMVVSENELQPTLDSMAEEREDRT